jgi:hypothetical protein
MEAHQKSVWLCPTQRRSDGTHLGQQLHLLLDGGRYVSQRDCSLPFLASWYVSLLPVKENAAKQQFGGFIE